MSKLNSRNSATFYQVHACYQLSPVRCIPPPGLTVSLLLTSDRFIALPEDTLGAMRGKKHTDQLCLLLPSAPYSEKPLNFVNEEEEKRRSRNSSCIDSTVDERPVSELQKLSSWSTINLSDVNNGDKSMRWYAPHWTSLMVCLKFLVRS